tara:strand:- start:154 stop:384 length:231 start_codon:yes stop_codon:yes gene_type:complete
LQLLELFLPQALYYLLNKILKDYFVRNMIRWLYLLFCKFGIHKYEKVDINYSFGPGGSTETIKCKDCGIKKIRRKN